MERKIAGTKFTLESPVEDVIQAIIAEYIDVEVFNKDKSKVVRDLGFLSQIEAYQLRVKAMEVLTNND